MLLFIYKHTLHNVFFCLGGVLFLDYNSSLMCSFPFTRTDSSPLSLETVAVSSSVVLLETLFLNLSIC